MKSFILSGHLYFKKNNNLFLEKLQLWNDWFDQCVQLKQLMIVGIDCYHDISAGKRSIGAMVASLNQSMSRFVTLIASF